jgi:hypothetical protein
MNRDRGGFDAVTFREAIAAPEQTWVSYGLVSPQQNVDGEVIDSVEFDDELGPLVNVRLQPSNREVRCRIASFVAGDGEGEYAPFIQNDEVLVIIPEGDLRSGPCIVGRLNNARAKWPAESIAGQDPTRNTFAFVRSRTPMVQEYASSYLVRSSVHGGFILMSDAGTITLRDGSKGALQIGPDIFGYTEGVPGEVDPEETPTPTALLQLDLTGRRAVLQMGDSQLQLNASDADDNKGKAFLTAPTELSVILGTNTAIENVATIESVLALLESFANKLDPTALAPAAIALMLAEIAAGGPPLSFQMQGALASGKPVAASAPKPTSPTGIQALPGLGAVLFKTG